MDAPSVEVQVQRIRSAGTDKAIAERPVRIRIGELEIPVRSIDLHAQRGCVVEATVRFRVAEVTWSEYEGPPLEEDPS